MPLFKPFSPLPLAIARPFRLDLLEQIDCRYALPFMARSPHGQERSRKLRSLTHPPMFRSAHH